MQLRRKVLMTTSNVRRIALLTFLLACFPISSACGDTPSATTVDQAYPGFTTGILKSAKMTEMEKGLLLEAKGAQIRESALKKSLDQAEPAIRSQLEKNLFFLLEQEALMQILVSEAKASGTPAKGLSDHELIKAFVSQLVEDVTVSDEEAKSFYEKNKEMMGGATFDQTKESIQEFLSGQKKQERIDSYVGSLGPKADIRINREWMDQQYAIAKDNPVDKARLSGRPAMVEFGATGCVPCDMMQPIMESLRKKYPEQLNVVFVHVGENQVLGARFGIRSIPVQVFFDRQGREVFRHQGFYPEKEIQEKLAELKIL